MLLRRSTIANLAKQYHQSVRKHSKLAESKCKWEEWKKAKSICKQSMQNFWKFSTSLFKGTDDSNTTKAICSAEDAHSFFSEVYTSQQHTFNQSQWLPSVPDPQSEEIHKEEAERAVKEKRANSSPSPIDEVLYLSSRNVQPPLHLFYTFSTYVGVREKFLSNGSKLWSGLSQRPQQRITQRI